jgi:cell division protein FtsZ
LDEIPAPAYQPQGEESDTFVVEEPAPLVATQNVRGTPSPEAMARLRAAVERVPGTEPRTSNESLMTPLTPAKSKFGINSLINRMTGHTESIEPSAVAVPSQVGGQAFETEEAGNEADEKIEIPAFLRRQAN